MSVFEVAASLVALCRAGKFAEAGETFWSDDVVSNEPMVGEMARLTGKPALRAKGEWWANAHEVHGVEVQEPFFNGDQFVVRFIMDLTHRESGVRQRLDELGAYKVTDGKIVEETFFVTEGYFARG